MASQIHSTWMPRPRRSCWLPVLFLLGLGLSLGWPCALLLVPPDGRGLALTAPRPTTTTAPPHIHPQTIPENTNGQFNWKWKTEN